LVRSLLLLRDVEPAAGVQVQAEPAPRMYTVQYTAGEARYVATLMPFEGKEADWSAPVDVTFPKAGFAYDVRKGLALGHAGSARTTLLAGDTAIFGVLPYRVSGLGVTPTPGAVALGTPARYDITVQAEGGPAGLHVVLVEVMDPSGAVRAHYNAQLLARDGKAGGQFVPALNDPPGRWTLRATDYVTRVAGSAQVDVRPE